MTKRLAKRSRKSRKGLRQQFVRALQPTQIKLALAICILALVITHRQQALSSIHPTAYQPLLGVIAKGESKGNYNAYFGKANNTTLRFTEMSVQDVMKWQAEYVQKGSVSSAVGRYQIIRPTLAGLVVQLRIDPNTPFDESLQDRMAIALLERRGARAFVQNKLSREEFAANLAKEWAALPKATGPNASQSHYAGDGINASNISLDEIYQALAALQARTQIKLDKES